jgi:hypothetical protein
MDQTEWKIHRADVDYLYQRVWKGNKIIHTGNPAFEDLVIIHIPNAIHTDDEAENARQGLFRKMMGVEAGAYDFIFGIPRHMPLAYDVKAPGGFLEAPQKRFREKWERCGYPSAWGTSPEHLRDTLIKHGAICKVFCVKPVDLRTKEEKFKDMYDFQKP